MCLFGLRYIMKKPVQTHMSIYIYIHMYIYIYSVCVFIGVVLKVSHIQLQGFTAFKVFSLRGFNRVFS